MFSCLLEIQKKNLVLIPLLRSNILTKMAEKINLKEIAEVLIPLLRSNILTMNYILVYVNTVMLSLNPFTQVKHSNSTPHNSFLQNNLQTGFRIPPVTFSKIQLFLGLFIFFQPYKSLRRHELQKIAYLPRFSPFFRIPGGLRKAKN